MPERSATSIDSAGCAQRQRCSYSSTVVLFDAAEHGNLLELAANCHDTEAGLSSGRFAQDGASSSSLHGSHRQTIERIYSAYETALALEHAHLIDLTDNCCIR